MKLVVSPEELGDISEKAQASSIKGLFPWHNLVVWFSPGVGPAP